LAELISDPQKLPSAWRTRAAKLREWGAPEATARLWEKAAAEVEQVLRRWDRTTLTLREAARESGYSADHLGALDVLLPSFLIGFAVAIVVSLLDKKGQEMLVGIDDDMRFAKTGQE